MTADSVAEELGTSRERTKRNAQRAELHDNLLESGDDDAAEIVKSLPQAEVAKVINESRENPKAAAESVKPVHVANASGNQPANDDEAAGGREHR